MAPVENTHLMQQGTVKISCRIIALKESAAMDAVVYPGTRQVRIFTTQGEGGMVLFLSPPAALRGPGGGSPWTPYYLRYRL